MFDNNYERRCYIIYEYYTRTDTITNRNSRNQPFNEVAFVNVDNRELCHCVSVFLYRPMMRYQVQTFFSFYKQRAYTCTSIPILQKPMEIYLHILNVHYLVITFFVE